MHLTTKQHLFWKEIKNIRKSHMKTCETCQLSKLPKSNYRKLPTKDNTLDMDPWPRICGEKIRPW